MTTLTRDKLVRQDSSMKSLRPWNSTTGNFSVGPKGLVHVAGAWADFVKFESIISETIEQEPNMAVKAQAVANAFASKVYAISGVKGVYAKVGPKQTLYLWTVVDRDDLALRDRVYDVEATMYTHFPEARLDFYVITLDRLGTRTLDQVIPKGFVQVPRGESNAAGSGLPTTSGA